jgi:hypothetical protein
MTSAIHIAKNGDSLLCPKACFSSRGQSGLSPFFAPSTEAASALKWSNYGQLRHPRAHYRDT